MTSARGLRAGRLDVIRLDSQLERVAGWFQMVSVRMRQFDDHAGNQRIHQKERGVNGLDVGGIDRDALRALQAYVGQIDHDSIRVAQGRGRSTKRLAGLDANRNGVFFTCYRQAAHQTWPFALGCLVRRGVFVAGGCRRCFGERSWNRQR